MPRPPPADTTADATGAPHAGLRLIVSSAAGVTAVSLPPKPRFVIGRDPEADVVVADATVSRRHVAMSIGAEVVVEDLGSKHGTRHLGAPLRPGEPRVIPSGSGIEIGSATVFVDRKISARRPDPRKPLGAIVVEDPAMRQIYAMLEVVGPSSLSVLVLGETGTGKEVFAEALHARSDRATRPFLKLNCAALSPGLLESELFGHEKGAFTGAASAKQGLLEAADGGTVFLDEVGELPADLQAKLLRVVESGELLRVGSVRTTRVDVRYVSATNADLEASVREGRFRADLFYRLDAFAVRLPALRDRPGDILSLARLFLSRVAERGGSAPAHLSDAAAQVLLGHAWPGNVRELKNVIEAAAVLARGRSEIGVDCLRFTSSPTPSTRPPPPLTAAGAPGLKRRVSEYEKEQILEALRASGGNQKQAASLLGIGRRTLIEKIEAYGIPRPRKGAPR